MRVMAPAKREWRGAVVSGWSAVVPRIHTVTVPIIVSGLALRHAVPGRTYGTHNAEVSHRVIGSGEGVPHPGNRNTQARRTAGGAIRRVDRLNTASGNHAR